jgi:hypothetical protein
VCRREADRLDQSLFPQVPEICATTRTGPPILGPARQIEVSREDLARVGATIWRIAIAVRPPHIVTIAMVVTIAGIVPVTPIVVVILNPRGTGATS